MRDIEPSRAFLRPRFQWESGHRNVCVRVCECSSVCMDARTPCEVPSRASNGVEPLKYGGKAGNWQVLCNVGHSVDVGHGTDVDSTESACPCMCLHFA